MGTAIPSDKDENGEVIKELDTKLHAWYSNKNEGFIGVIVKSDAVTNQDHYFLWGTKRSVSSLNYQHSMNRNNPVLYGVIVGKTAHGNFYAFYAGNNSILFKLELYGREKRIKTFLVIDQYDELMMRYEFSQEIPFIGIKKGAKIVSTMFPPKATKFAKNEVSQPSNLTEGSSIQFCTCPDGSIYPTKMANADPEVPDCFGGQSSMAFKQGN